MLLLLFLIVLGKPKLTESIGLPTPTPIEVKNPKTKELPAQTAPSPQKRADRIKFEFILPKNILLMSYFDSKLYIDEKFLKNLRGGTITSSKILDLIIIASLLYAINQSPQAQAFLQQCFSQLARMNAPTVNPGQGPYQYRIAMSKSKSTQQGRDSPFEMGHFKSGPTQTQTESFRKANLTYDVEKGSQEVLRRARYSQDFQCSRERFVQLALEQNTIAAKSMQKAINALQVEADDKNGEITHLEIKGPVGASIKKAQDQNPSILIQGRAIGTKIQDQVHNWVNSSKPVTKPTTPNNILVVVDLFDLPLQEKHEMQRQIQFGLETEAVHQ